MGIHIGSNIYHLIYLRFKIVQLPGIRSNPSLPALCRSPQRKMVQFKHKPSQPIRETLSLECKIWYYNIRFFVWRSHLEEWFHAICKRWNIELNFFPVIYLCWKKSVYSLLIYDEHKWYDRFFNILPTLKIVTKDNWISVPYFYNAYIFSNNKNC